MSCALLCAVPVFSPDSSVPMVRPFLFCSIFAVLASLAPAKEIHVTPQSSGSYALAHTPALASARFRIEEARGRLQQSGRLSNPELEIESTHNSMGREGSCAIGFS